MARRELTCICLLLVMITDSLGTTIQSRGSQFPRSARNGTDADHDASELANPRVGPSTTRGLGASSTSGVKFSGGHTGNSMQLEPFGGRGDGLKRKALRGIEGDG